MMRVCMMRVCLGILIFYAKPLCAVVVSFSGLGYFLSGIQGQNNLFYLPPALHIRHIK